MQIEHLEDENRFVVRMDDEEAELAYLRAGPKVIDSFAHTPHKLGQTSLVIRRHNLARNPALRLVGHGARLLTQTAAVRYLDGHDLNAACVAVVF